MRTVVGLAIAGVLIAASIAFAAMEFSRAFVQARTVDRTVTVKGLAEREVVADTAIWPLRFTATHDDLDRALAKLAADEKTVHAFLTAGGIDAAEIGVQQFSVVDQLAQQYQSGPVRSRYIVNETLLVRSGAIDKVAKLAQDVGQLVTAGVILSTEGGFTSGPNYLFTRLNAIKPAMLAEALANAREGASAFARDAGAKVGGIRRAWQGVFQILPRDQAPGLYEQGQINKTVRVVSTIDYALVD
ncbi:MAG: SIMPL domain-containing protein [Alphaproteobacteria bacterium]|nr:SIMPL domain-containing protein [Alphaproteobacteria bacterium]MCB9929627.1 SIMPL domain-containing protein [Alphaproteobacteria bacterium]